MLSLTRLTKRIITPASWGADNSSICWLGVHSRLGVGAGAGTSAASPCLRRMCADKLSRNVAVTPSVFSLRSYATPNKQKRGPARGAGTGGRERRAKGSQEPKSSGDKAESHRGVAQRVSKKIAHLYASRRKADVALAEGRVQVDGQVAAVGDKCSDDASILVDGVKVGNQRPKLWMFYKPPGMLVTHDDPQGRPTVFEYVIAKGGPPLIAVGRLDMNSEGLLLLTNSGALAHVLEHPKGEVERVYKVRCKGEITEDKMKALKRGVKVDGEEFSEWKVLVERRTSSHTWLTVTFAEGKNREIHRVLGSMGVSVSRIIRTQFGPYKLVDGAARGTFHPVGIAKAFKQQLFFMSKGNEAWKSNPRHNQQFEGESFSHNDGEDDEGDDYSG